MEQFTKPDHFDTVTADVLMLLNTSAFFAELSLSVFFGDIVFSSWFLCWVSTVCLNWMWFVWYLAVQQSPNDTDTQQQPTQNPSHPSLPATGKCIFISFQSFLPTRPWLFTCMSAVPVKIVFQSSHWFCWYLLVMIDALTLSLQCTMVTVIFMLRPTWITEAAVKACN